MCQLSLLKKEGASVSVGLWLICLMWLSWGESAGSSGPSAATSQSSSLLPLHLTTTADHDSSPQLLSVKISQSNLFPTSAPPLLFSSLRSNNRTQRKHQDVLRDKAVADSNAVWCLSVQEVSAKNPEWQTRSRFVNPAALLRDLLLEGLFSVYIQSFWSMESCKASFCDANDSGGWNKHQPTACSIIEVWWKHEGDERWATLV